MMRTVQAIGRWLDSQFLGTKVIANGDPRVGDVKLGWFAKIVIGAALAGLTAGVNRLFYISAKIDVIDERTITTDRHARENAEEIKKVREDLAEKYAKAQEVHAGFLKRDEFFDYMAPEIRRPRRNP